MGVVRIVLDETRHRDVCLLEGADSSAMRAAVDAAIKDFVPAGDSWYLVDGDDDMVVPLCSALPNGVSLALRTSSGRLRPTTSTPSSPAANARTLSFSRDASTFEKRATDPASVTSPRQPGLLSASEGFDSCRDPSVTNSSRQMLMRPFQELRQLINGVRGSGHERVLGDFERWSRLSTELANERTLLAWIRTSLAAERTVFTFLGFKATNGPGVWQHIYFAATGLLATVTIVFGVVGVERFYKVKHALSRAQPPATYSRITIQPALLCLGIVLAVAAICTYSHVLAKV